MPVPTPPARMIVKRTSRVIWSLSPETLSHAVAAQRLAKTAHGARAKSRPALAPETQGASPALAQTTPTVAEPNPVPNSASAAAPVPEQWHALLTELATLAGTLRDIVQAASLPAAAPPQDPAPPKPKRKYTPRKTDQRVDPVPLTERKWITIKQAAAIYSKSEQAWRHLVHQCGQYLKHPKAGLPSNGFEKCIVRQPGSRNVYLIVEELDRWMAQGQEGAQ